jgi:hypothetical protein
MRASKRIVVLALGLFLAAAPAGAGSGVGVLTGTDPGAGTVSIDGRVYQVDATTRIEDEAGLPLQFEDLDRRMQAGRDGLTELYRLLAVRYEAVESGGQRVLVRLAVARAPE